MEMSSFMSQTLDCQNEATFLALSLAKLKSSSVHGSGSHRQISKLANGFSLSLNLYTACVRGYLVRKRFQSIREDYEDIVKEIEGHLGCLQWKKCTVSQPVFLPKPRERKGLSGRGTAWEGSQTQEGKQRLCQEELLPEKECDDKLQHGRQLPADVVAEVEVGDTGQNLEHPEDRLPEDACVEPGETEEGKTTSDVSSEWSTTILEMASPSLSQELHFRRAQGMPQTVSDLQRYRKNLAMELLWLQQAIESRKNYLVLKQRLGSPR